jgi:hypothetical protein
MAKSLYFLRSDCSADHQLFNLADGFGRIKPLGADIHAVHDGVTAKEPVRIFEIIEPFAGGLIPTVCNEPIGLQKARRANKLIRVPPK